MVHGVHTPGAHLKNNVPPFACHSGLSTALSLMQGNGQMYMQLHTTSWVRIVFVADAHQWCNSYPSSVVMWLCCHNCCSAAVMALLLQVGFVMCLTGGRLPEELAELLPDYSLAFIREDGPAGLAAEGGGCQHALRTANIARLNCQKHTQSIHNCAATHVYQPAFLLRLVCAMVAAGVEGVQLDSCCAYYHCDCTQQLNSQYGDMQYKIQDLEVSSKLLIGLSQCMQLRSVGLAQIVVSMAATCFTSLPRVTPCSVMRGTD